MAPVVDVRQLRKTYRVAQKRGEGLRASLRDLFYRQYKEVHAVRDLSFAIEPGEFVGFLGPNGAGKTTTLKMLSGLIFPSAGSATVLGFVPWERPNEYRRQFSLVMGQKNQLWWDLPARESFRLHREIYAIPEPQFRATLDHLIDLLALGNLISQPVRELSLGERMKMELVASLLHSPRILFLDEPTIGLDVVAQTQLRSFLKEYNRTRDVTVMLTSHYMKDVESLCDRAIVINDGRLIYDGSLQGIINRFSQYKIVSLQFADPPPAALPEVGEIVERNDPVLRVRIPRGEVPKRLAAVLAAYRIDDITVDEVPLDQVIAEVFLESNKKDVEAGES